VLLATEFTNAQYFQTLFQTTLVKKFYIVYQRIQWYFIYNKKYYKICLILLRVCWNFLSSSCSY